ncbi:Eco57I restriction-modification methylase domain-containing protein [Candidatus Poriferisodalis sp.]|uniref:Eco57I restriction-modification methylase domain-containing protein n=1 Tax=Candidatus Poriferisodalis sp. TaxID=3101277 RepID=UPI003B01BE79
MSQLMLLKDPKTVLRTAFTSSGARGEVFTRRWVVDLVLDLAGYRAETDLGRSVIVEPACGRGAFLVPIVERLAESCARYGRSLDGMGTAIMAFDLMEHNVQASRESVEECLKRLGIRADVAKRLSSQWITRRDFLLEGWNADGRMKTDYVVGNPPYLRLEDVPADIGEAYRAQCSTMRGRADIYIGFFERGLSLLAAEGRLAFICADRWMHNQYGRRLRALVAAQYSMDAVVVMHRVDAFEELVSAYPAITVLRNGSQGTAHIVEADDGFDELDGRTVADGLVRGLHPASVHGHFKATRLNGWFSGSGQWPSGSTRTLELVSYLESNFAPLEDQHTGTRVGIGVATGCDDVFVVNEATGVELCRLLPLLTARDIVTGTPRWGGRFLVNPWESGRLVDLEKYPGLAAYLQRHDARIRARYVARKRPATWYRTIDRVDPDLQGQPKLLLPDLKPASHPVLDAGGFYPHHNLYYIVSDTWDLEVLGGLLLSDFTNLLIGAYCVKMRGGTYRFQAQYIRKVRVPLGTGIDSGSAEALASAFRRRDRVAATDAAAPLYRISISDLSATVT